MHARKRQEIEKSRKRQEPQGNKKKRKQKGQKAKCRRQTNMVNTTLRRPFQTMSYQQIWKQ